MFISLSIYHTRIRTRTSAVVSRNSGSNPSLVARRLFRILKKPAHQSPKGPQRTYETIFPLQLFMARGNCLPGDTRAHFPLHKKDH